jgi:ligand-binding sensor domain-containing protein
LYALQEKEITGMAYHLDTLWVAADKGVGLFVYFDNEYHFVDYYVNFPIMPSSISDVALFQNRIWIATDKGLLSAPSDVSKNTLNDPANWKLFTKADGLSNSSILDITVIKNELWVGAKIGLSVIDSSLNIRIEDAWGQTSADAATKISCSADGQYFIAGYNSLYRYIPNQEKILFKKFDNTISALAADDDGGIWAGIHKNGYYHTSWDKPKRIDGLYSNSSKYILRDSKGRLWSSTGKYKSTPNNGFAILENESWKSIDYLGSNWSNLGNSDVLFEDHLGNVFIGSWGGGVIILPHDESEFVYLHNYDVSGEMILRNVDSTSIIELPAIDEKYRGFFSSAVDGIIYEVIGEIKEDRNGNVWFANFGAANSNYIAVAPHDESGMISLDKSDWQYFGAQPLMNSVKYINSIAFDDLNRVWFGAQKDGVYILDYNNTLYDTSDDKLYHLGIANNLFSVEILSLACDKNGIMWIGTKGGLNSVDEYSVGSNPQVMVYKHIGDEKGNNGPLGNWINQIRVDEYNNKWIATSKGLSILADNKSPWEEGAWIGYTMENSGLADNNVHSISFDKKTGEAYIGTEKGISIYKGKFSELRADYSQAVCGPNPFHLNSGKKFIIKNLMNNSTVKIYTINGKLIKTLTVENNDILGGRALWNGLDDSDHAVSSGVYFFLAYNAEGNSVAGKIAVIRD